MPNFIERFLKDHFIYSTMVGAISIKHSHVMHKYQKVTKRLLNHYSIMSVQFCTISHKSLLTDIPNPLPVLCSAIYHHGVYTWITANVRKTFWWVNLHCFWLDPITAPQQTASTPDQWCVNSDQIAMPRLYASRWSFIIAISQASIMHNEFDNYTFRITSVSPRDQRPLYWSHYR